MDGATTTVVILIFVFSIIGAATNKKGDENAPSPVQTQIEERVDVVHTTVEVDIPPYEFVDDIENKQKIKTFILSYAKKVSEYEADEISRSIVSYSKQYNVNPKLVTALIARESRFNKYAISSSGACGLGQLLPSTASGLGVSDPFDIDQNVKGTVRYMKSMLDRFNEPNKVPYAIAGYFEGPNAVKRKGGFKPKSKSYVEDILKIYYKI